MTGLQTVGGGALAADMNESCGATLAGDRSSSLQIRCEDKTLAQVKRLARGEVSAFLVTPDEAESVRLQSGDVMVQAM